jgi:deoxyribonuclease V
MKPVFHHPWNLTEAEALILQQELAKKVIKEDNFNDIKYIAGVDVAYNDKNDLQIAAVIVLDKLLY